MSVEVVHLLSGRSTCRKKEREREKHIKYPLQARATLSIFGLDHKNLNTMPWCIQSLFPRLAGVQGAQSLLKFNNGSC